VEDTQDQPAARELRVLRRWNPPFIILLWVLTSSTGSRPRPLVRAEGAAKRRAWMLLSVVANLGMLLYFKYGTFLLHNFAALMAGLGVDYRPSDFDIVLPVGISFYTSRRCPTRSMSTCAAPCGPQFPGLRPVRDILSSPGGRPIMRPTELVPQFEQERRANAQQLRFGLALMTLGLFQKVVLADTFLSKRG